MIADSPCAPSPISSCTRVYRRSRRGVKPMPSVLFVRTCRNPVGRVAPEFRLLSSTKTKSIPNLPIVYRKYTHGGRGRARLFPDSRYTIHLPAPVYFTLHRRSGTCPLHLTRLVKVSAPRPRGSAGGRVCGRVTRPVAECAPSTRACPPRADRRARRLRSRTGRATKCPRAPAAARPRA